MNAKMIIFINMSMIINAIKSVHLILFRIIIFALKKYLKVEMKLNLY